MAFAIARMTKQKGGGVGSSGHHNDRTRETPNADPERLHLNRVLIGGEKNVHEAVSRIIAEHGGRPRRDSVEAVEYVLTASPEWFDERDPERHREKVERFVEQAVKFLEDPRSGGTWPRQCSTWTRGRRTCRPTRCRSTLGGSSTRSTTSAGAGR